MSDAASRALALDQVLLRHAALFTAHLGRFRPFSDIAPGFFGVDYYSYDKLRAAVSEIPAAEQVQFVSILFLDALLDTALHAHGGELRSLLPRDRPVFVINTYNILNAPDANISHRHPQVLLGLIQNWDKTALDELAYTVREYLWFLGARLTKAGVGPMDFALFMRALSSDPDLDALPDCLGPVPGVVGDTYRQEICEAADAAGVSGTSRSGPRRAS